MVIVIIVIVSSNDIPQEHIPHKMFQYTIKKTSIVYNTVHE